MGKGPRAKCLLVSGMREHPWHRAVEEAVAALARLDMTDEKQAFELMQRERYELVIVDSTAVPDASLLVARIKARWPDCRVVLASASPTWTRAREAFYAGADDYMYQTMNRDEIRSVLGRVLSVHPPRMGAGEQGDEYGRPDNSLRR